jgi:hypothetical protein
MHRLPLPFLPGNFWKKKNNITLVHHPTYFSLFPRLKIKLKGYHFDTIEAMESESEAVLNTLTEHDFQDAFKKWQIGWEQGIPMERDYFNSGGGVSFCPDGLTSPGNYGWLKESIIFLAENDYLCL